MKKLLLLSILIITLYSCNSDNKEYEKVKNISEEWVTKNIFPLYESPAIKNVDRNDKTYKKIAFDGAFDIVEDEMYDLEPYSKQYIFEIKSKRLNIDDEFIAAIHHLEKLTDIEEKIYNSSNYAIKLISENKPTTYYMCRIFITFKDDIAKEYNLDKVSIDVLLDEKMNVLNKL